MGGELRASSDGPGCGATFTLMVPVGVPDEATAARTKRISLSDERRRSLDEQGEGDVPARPRAPPPPALATPPPALRVLVADDDALCRTVVCAMLRRLGATAVAVATGAAAVSAFAEARGGFELVLLDYHMPEMQGPAAAAAITRMAALYGHLPRICVLTGDIEAQAAAAISAAGAVLLLKPIQLDAVEAQLRAACAAPAAPHTPEGSKRQHDSAWPAGAAACA
jgi:CheY-like chemotaxis protein